MRPTIVCEVSYEAPGDPPVWVDESAYLRRPWSVHRGRSTELDKQNTGTATVTFDNRTGRFDPANASGAHYPNVVPMRRLRLRTDIATDSIAFVVGFSAVGSTSVLEGGGTIGEALFTGFVESWSQTWANTNGDASVTATCVDGFAVFNLNQFIWGYRYVGGAPVGADWVCGLPSLTNITPDTGPPLIPNELTGERIVRILDCVGWPASDRLLDTGTVTLWGSDGVTNIRVSDNALSHLLSIADTEGGLLFIDKNGDVRFIDADHLPVAPDSSEAYGGTSPEIGYQDIESAPFDTSRLWNDVTLTTNASTLTGETQTEDATSIADYYRRETSITILATASASRIVRAAAYLAKYKDPHFRIEGLVLRPTHEEDWRRILAHELGDWIRARKRPAGADVIDQDVRIEGISIAAGSDTNTTPSVTFKVSSG